jgi:hypothetical protein
MINLDNIDLTKKENQTFRNWFALMWQNFYIAAFIISLAIGVGILCSSFDTASGYLLALIPFTAVGVIAYKAFYQFWNDQKEGTSR